MFAWVIPLPSTPRVVGRVTSPFHPRRYLPATPPSRGGRPCAGIVADGRPLRRVPRIPGRSMRFVRSYKRWIRRETIPAKGPHRGRPARRPPASSSSSPDPGTNLQALLDAIAAAGPRPTAPRSSPSAPTATGIAGLERAERAGLPTFVVPGQGLRRPARSGTRRSTEAVAAHEPDLVVSAGFMKIVGKEFLARFGGRFVNTHPALLPSFPGRPRRARRARVRREGHRLHRPLRRRRRRHRPDHRPGRGRGPGRGRRGALCTSASRKSSERCSSTSWGGSPATAIALRDER